MYIYVLASYLSHFFKQLQERKEPGNIKVCIAWNMVAPSIRMCGKTSSQHGLHLGEIESTRKSRYSMCAREAVEGGSWAPVQCPRVNRFIDLSSPMNIYIVVHKTHKWNWRSGSIKACTRRSPSDAFCGLSRSQEKIFGRPNLVRTPLRVCDGEVSLFRVCDGEVSLLISISQFIFIFD